MATCRFHACVYRRSFYRIFNALPRPLSPDSTGDFYPPDSPSVPQIKIPLTATDQNSAATPPFPPPNSLYFWLTQLPFFRHSWIIHVACWNYLVVVAQCSTLVYKSCCWLTVTAILCFIMCPCIRVYVCSTSYSMNRWLACSLPIFIATYTKFNTKTVLLVQIRGKLPYKLRQINLVISAWKLFSSLSILRLQSPSRWKPQITDFNKDWFQWCNRTDGSICNGMTKRLSN